LLFGKSGNLGSRRAQEVEEILIDLALNILGRQLIEGPIQDSGDAVLAREHGDLLGIRIAEAGAKSKGEVAPGA
jgi:hypothetical protein